MEKYDNFNVLVGDMKKYIRENPNAKIIENDDGLGLSIRYYDESVEGVGWEINIKDLHEWCKSPEALERDYGNIIRRCFLSQEGKKALLDTILKAR